MADAGKDEGPATDLAEQVIAGTHRRAGDPLNDEPHPGDADGAADGAGAIEVVGPASSPSRGGASAASVKVARAFQIIQPPASRSAAAVICARTCSAVYGGKEPYPKSWIQGRMTTGYPAACSFMISRVRSITSYG
jgi:hypothetical protein